MRWTSGCSHGFSAPLDRPVGVFASTAFKSRRQRRTWSSAIGAFSGEEPEQPSALSSSLVRSFTLRMLWLIDRVTHPPVKVYRAAEEGRARRRPPWLIRLLWGLRQSCFVISAKAGYDGDSHFTKGRSCPRRELSFPYGHAATSPPCSSFHGHKLVKVAHPLERSAARGNGVSRTLYTIPSACARAFLNDGPASVPPRLL